MTRWLLPLALALTVAGQTPQPGQASGLEARAWPLLSPAPGGVHVIVFVGTECPISNRYAPEIRRMIQDYAGKGVRFFLSYEDPAGVTTSVPKHLGEFYPNIRISSYVDPDHALARELGARATPTAVIYTSAGRVYRGRIDDLYLSLTQARREPTERTLRLSLDAVLAGRPVPNPETPAVGCSIGGSS
jgi:hypothetical protein